MILNIMEKSTKLLIIIIVFRSYSGLIQFYLVIIYWTIVDSYMCLYHLQDKAKNLKRVYLIQTNKKQIQGHNVNQREQGIKQLLKLNEYILMDNKYIITYEMPQ
jgi:hypothetical protein